MPLLSQSTPSPPPEPRWWVLMNGKTEGPHSYAYIMACIGAGKISNTAMLCLEGEQRWLPLPLWPHFAVTAGPTATYALPPPGANAESVPTVQAFPSVHVGPSVSMSQKALSKSNILTLVVGYAQFVSPALFLVLNGACCLNGVIFIEYSEGLDVLLCFVTMFIEILARGFLMGGALQTHRNANQGTGLVMIGAGVLLALWLLVLLGQVLTLLIAVGTEGANPDVSILIALLCLTIPIYLGESVFLGYLLLNLYDYRKRFRRAHA